MISFQWKVTGLVLFGLIAGVWSPAVSALTLSEAVSEALVRHPGLQAEQLRVGTLERDRDWSLQAFYPTLTAGIGGQRWNETKNHRALVGLTPTFSGPTLTGLVPQVFEPDANTLGAQAKLEWTFGVAGFASMAAAEAAQAAGMASLAGQRASLVVGVKKAFSSILALDLALDLARRQESAAKARFDLVESGRLAGSRPESEALQARAAWTERTIERFQAESRGAEARQSLALLLGRPLDAPLELEGQIEPRLVDPEQGGTGRLEASLTARPDSLALDAQAKALDAQVLGALALALPQVVVGWSVDPSVNNWLNKSLTDSSQWSQLDGAFSVQLQWKLDSLLPGSKFWTLRSDLDDYRAGLKLVRDNTQRSARSEVARLVRSIRDGLRILPLREQQAADARRAAQLSQAAFQAGVQRIVEVQDADVQAQRAELGLIQERLQLVFAQADLEMAFPNFQEENNVQ